MCSRQAALCKPLAVILSVLLSGWAAAQGVAVKIGSAGQISVSYRDRTIINYEMLQLVDTHAGWATLFQYGRSKSLRRKESDGTIIISESMPGVISYTKRISNAGSEVLWEIDYEVAANTQANRNFYFLDIPQEALSGACYRIETAKRRLAGEVRKDGIEKIVPEVKQLEFFSPDLHIQFWLDGENACWLFTDWTATRHKSYRLRTEKELNGQPIKATVRVKLRVTPVSPAQFEAMKRRLEAEQKAQREARLAELGLRMQKRLRIGPVTANADQVAQYAKLELTFPVEGTFTNPFDPDQIDVCAEFYTPSGKRLRVPAFFFQDFVRTKDGIVRIGKPAWKVRFAPVEVGRYRYRIIAKNQGRRVATAEESFTCTPREHRGYIRVSHSNPLYFEFDNGEPYFPSGINVFVTTKLGSGIPPDRLDRCERWMDALADHGGNFIRLRMDSWWMPIEMTPDEACGYFGLGYYHQQSCWEIDRIYDKASARGIYIMHCLDNANASVNGNVSKYPWRAAYNLYLKRNGGVCETADEFWTNPEARRYVRNKLRYCVARWGYSTSLMCWEFWNEVACRPQTIDAAAAWHRDMARYLRSIDPWNHPITTSLMRHKRLAKKIWELPEIEIIQHHFYSQTEMVPPIMELTRSVVEPFRKPFFLGEYGVGPAFRPGDCTYDKAGIHMHNGMWAAMFAGGSGAGAMWYVNDYVERFNLWFHYRALANFAKRVPWNAPDLTRCEVDAPAFVRLPERLHYTDLRIPTSTKYAFQKSPKTDFVVGPDGTVIDWEMLRPQLNASRAIKSPPTFHLTLDRPARFVVKVNRSVGDETNKLLVYLDGRRVVEQPFPAGKEFNPESEYIARYKNWITPYNKEVVVEVPAGRHTVRCEAVGKDRLEVEYFLRGAIAFERSRPVRAFGLRTSHAAYLWFQNRSSTWWTAWEGKAPIPLQGLTTRVHGLSDGTYRVEWYDTWQGKVTSTTTAECKGGVIELTLPKLTRDVACIVTKK